MLIQGYSIIGLRTVPTKIIVNLIDNDISTGDYIIGFPGVSVPTTSRGPDLYIYSREMTLAGEDIKEYINYKYVSFAHDLNTATSITRNFPTSFSDSTLMSTAVSFVISLQPSAAITTSDSLIFTYDPNHMSVTTASVEITPTASYNSLYYYIKAGWIVYQPISTIGTGSATTFTLAGMSNPSYIAGSSIDYISAWSWNSFKTARNPGV